MVAAMRSVARPVRPACSAEASSRVPATRAGLGRSANRCPAMVACPVSGRVRPVSARKVVVLPAPLGPRNPVTVPCWQVNVTSSTATIGPYRLVRLVTEIMFML